MTVSHDDMMAGLDGGLGCAKAPGEFCLRQLRRRASAYQRLDQLELIVDSRVLARTTPRRHTLSHCCRQATGYKTIDSARVKFMYLPNETRRVRRRSTMPSSARVVGLSSPG